MPRNALLITKQVLAANDNTTLISVFLKVLKYVISSFTQVIPAQRLAQNQYLNNNDQVLKAVERTHLNALPLSLWASQSLYKVKPAQGGPILWMACK